MCLFEAGDPLVLNGAKLSIVSLFSVFWSLPQRGFELLSPECFYCSSGMDRQQRTFSGPAVSLCNILECRSVLATTFASVSQGPSDRHGENAVKIGFRSAVIAAGLFVTAAAADAAIYQVTTRADIVFAEHDGAKLLGDLYLPKGLDKAPVLVAVHGGGWQVGSRKFYTNWGAYLSRNGIAVFAIEYRLMKPGVNT